MPEDSTLSTLINKLTYRQKFAFVLALLLLALLTSSYFLLEAQNQMIEIEKKEMMGSQYIRPLRRLVEDLQQHRILAARYLLGDEAIKNDFSFLQSQVVSDFVALKDMDQKFEKQLQTSETDFRLIQIANATPEELEKSWESVNKKFLNNDLEASEALHNNLLLDLSTLFKYIGSTSHLLFNANGESFQLSHAILNQIPEIEDYATDLAILTNTILLKKTVSPEEKSSLSLLLNQLKKHFLFLSHAIERSFIENRKLINNYEIEVKLSPSLNQFQQSMQEFTLFIEKNILHAKEISASTADFYSFTNHIITSGYAFWDASVDQLDHLLTVNIESRSTKRNWVLFISVLLAGLGALLGYLLVQSITQHMDRMIFSAKSLASGDLAIRMPVNASGKIKETSKAFNLIAESFQSLISQFQKAGIQLTTSTTEIASAARQQESTVVEQEATTKEIAITAKQISSTAKDFAKTMNTISLASEQTSALAASGKQGLGQMEAIMRQMVDASANIASKLAVINDKVSTITNVITTITRVADQTNLLSLNAAIEAEKAGEHGKSFSVIAREIRRLADQTANATLDIEKMVNEMISAVSAGVVGVENFTEEIRSGVNHITTVGDQLSKIIEQVEDQTQSFESVNQGMQAQSYSAEQITQSITQLSDTAQQATSSIRQFHSAIERLNSAAREMQSVVTKINSSE